MRAGRAVAVVLDLVDTDDVGIEAEDGGDRLGPLAVELGLRVGTAAVRGSPADAVGAVVDGVGQAVEGVEVVEQVQARDPHVPVQLDGSGTGRGFAATKCATPPSALIGRIRNALPLAALPGPRVGHDPGQVGDGVAAPEGVARAEAAAPPRPKRIGSGFWLWSASSTMILRRSFAAWRAIAAAPGATTAVGLSRRPLGRHDHLAEAAELEVLGHGHRLRDADEHALVGLEGRRRRDREADVGRRDRARVPQSTIDVTDEIWVWSWNSAALPVTRTSVAVADRVVVAVEHEDRRPTSRGPRRRRVLEVEAAERRATDPRSRR